MRTTRVCIEGAKGTAVIARRPDSENIVVEVTIAHRDITTLRANASDSEALWGLAQRVQHMLDGHRGAGGDIREYFRVIEILSDL
jgi:hypothetical protein